MGARNFGDDDPVNMAGTTPPDEIEINRGTCGRVNVVGWLHLAIPRPLACHEWRKWR
jgi:hypothetical protein